MQPMSHASDAAFPQERSPGKRARCLVPYCDGNHRQLGLWRSSLTWCSHDGVAVALASVRAVLHLQIFGLAPEALPHDVERLPLEPAQGGSDVSRRFNALLECVVGPACMRTDDICIGYIYTYMCSTRC